MSSLWRTPSLLNSITPASLSRRRFLQSIAVEKTARIKGRIIAPSRSTLKTSSFAKGESTSKQKPSKAEGDSRIDALLRTLKKKPSRVKEQTIDVPPKAKAETKKRSSRTEEATINAPAATMTKMLSKIMAETRTSFMFPALHQKVTGTVAGYLATAQFHKKDSAEGSNNEYSTSVMGKFTCNNQACSASIWTSKKVAIMIRGYPGNQYNAVVFNQRCKSCEQLGTFSLDQTSYVDRVAYRLKKWAGIRMEHRSTSPVDKGPAHERSLCEGCRLGVCPEY